MNELLMLVQQKNIENMVLKYKDEPICNIGGFFSLKNEEERAVVPDILSFMQVIHSSLRLCFTNEEGKMKLCDVGHKRIPVIENELRKNDFSEIEKVINKWLEIPFKVGEPLCDFAIFHFGADRWYVAEKFHHIVADRKTINILILWQQAILKEILEKGFLAVYEKKYVDDRFINRMMKGQQKQYATKEQLETWLENNFSDTSKNWMDKKSGVSSVADMVKMPVPKGVFEKLLSFAAKNKVTAESVWYAAICAEKCHRKGISHIVLGRVIEYRKHNEKDIAGMFSRVIPVSFERGDIIQNENADICRQFEEKFRTGLRYGEYSLSEMAEYSRKTDVSFDTVISFHPSSYMVENNERFFAFENRYIDTPLRIWINSWEQEPSIQIFYQTECYERKYIENLAKRYIEILAQLIGDIPFEKISLLSESDRNAYKELNYQMHGKNLTKTVFQLFLENMCIADDHRVYLEDENMKFKRKDILNYFCRIYYFLSEFEIGKGDIVGICIKRSVYLPLLMYAIMTREAAFLPVSVGESEERKLSLKDKCRIFIEEKDFEKIIKKEYNMLSCKETVKKIIDKEYSIEEMKNLRSYMLYTSGSTGISKCVQISQYSLMCRLDWMNEYMGAGKRTMQKTVYTFDVSLWELLLPLAYGAELYILPQEYEKLPDVLMETIEKQGITRLHFVPAMLDVFLRYVEDRLKKEGKTVWEQTVRELVVSGEELKRELVLKAYRLMPGIKLFNLYGPTECTIDVSYHLCDRCEKKVPIGKAVANTRLLVMSPDKKNIMPIGVEGELCVFGDLVGMGYANTHDTGGYCEIFGEKAYLTGDFAYLNENSELIYCGRKDEQKKLRGMRIDTVGIEDMILQLDKRIENVVVIVYENRLVCFYEARQSIDDLQNRLKKLLPSYSVPTVWQWYSEFPKSSSGKISQKALESEYRRKNEVFSTDKTISGYEGSDIREILKSIVKNILCVENINYETDIFEIGLDSFGAIQLINKINDMGYKCSFSQIYRYPTIDGLSKQIQSAEKEVIKTKTGVKLDYLKRVNKKSLLLCIPYGAGDSEIFAELARNVNDMPCDMAVVLQEQTLQQGSGYEAVLDIAKDLYKLIKEYNEVTIFSYCVGSAIALALARIIKKSQLKLKRVYIAGSLPENYIKIIGRKYTIWDFLNDREVYYILKKLNKAKGKDKTKKQNAPVIIEKIPRFRVEARRFFDYMEYEKKAKYAPVEAPLTLIFGEEDILTRKWKKRQPEWKKYFKASFQIVCIKSAGHYFSKSCFEKIAELMKKNETSD